MLLFILSILFSSLVFYGFFRLTIDIYSFYVFKKKNIDSVKELFEKW